MQGEQGTGRQDTTTIQVITDWLNQASPDDVITAAKQTLARVGELDQVYKDRFYTEAKQDPTIVGLFEELKTIA